MFIKPQPQERKVYLPITKQSLKSKPRLSEMSFHWKPTRARWRHFGFHLERRKNEKKNNTLMKMINKGDTFQFSEPFFFLWEFWIILERKKVLWDELKSSRSETVFSQVGENVFKNDWVSGQSIASRIGKIDKPKAFSECYQSNNVLKLEKESKVEITCKGGISMKFFD